ncbi:hypothetical protein Tco_0201260, partial [Tanacetum coccineum]
MQSLIYQHHSGLAVPVFKQGDDPIDAINKMISFLSTVVTSCFPSTNNQLRNSSNPRQQEQELTLQEQEGIIQFREKVLLVKAQRNGKVLIEEELEVLADPGTVEAKAVLMANLSSYGSDVLSENELHSDSNIIPYSQYLIESQNATVQDTNSSAQQDALILSVFEQLSNQVTNCNKVNNDNLITNETLFAELKRYKERVKLIKERQNVDLGSRKKLLIDDIIREKNAQFADFEKEINNLKQTLSEQSKEKELLTKIVNVFKNKSKEKEAKNIEIALEKKVKELDNIIRTMLYDGSVIAKETNVISIADSEETLML